MYKPIFILYCLSLIAPAHAQTTMTDIALIELLGEFDQEDTLILEASMEALNDQRTTDEEKAEQTGVNNEDTAE